MFHAKGWMHVAAAALLLMLSTVVRAEEKYKLEEPADDIRIYGVGTRMSVTGKVQTEPKAKALSQTVSAALSYRERRLLGPGINAEAMRSVREYQVAEVDINVDGNKTAAKLPDPLKLIVAQGRIDGVELYGMNGLLTADELDLLHSPADSLALISLLPANEVAVGDEWKAPGWAFQMLTALDAIVKGDLDCKLESVEKGIALVTVQGTLEGAAMGALTQVTVSGSYKYNLNDKYISDADFTQKETRALGPVIPALDLTARVRVLRQPGTAPGKLADSKVIETAGSEPAETAKYLRFESPWNIGIQHGRHWHIYKIYEKLAVFRLVELGNFIAQCDMAEIPAVKPGTHLPEQTYLNDIRQSLGERLKTMTNGEVVPSSERKFVFKVKADGVVGDKETSWIFYLIADPSGRQASLMFTLSPTLMDELKNYDHELVDSIQFGPPPPARSANK